jgi:hypothetical protein
MRSMRTKLAATAVAAALILSPTAAASATMSSAVQPASNDWVTLSQMTPAGATALAGSGVVAGAPDAATVAGSAAVAQSSDDGAEGANPFPLPVIAVLLAVVGVMVYIALVEDHDGHITFPGGSVSPD